jgi:hypothetical protein
MLRLAIYLLALAGVAVGTCRVMFELTATCVIRKNQSQFVWAQLSLERFGKALERYREEQKLPGTASRPASLGSQFGRERLERPIHQTALNRPMGTAIHI